jgi:hypothetical protein
MGSYAEWVSRILTEEVDEIRVEQWVPYVELDCEVTRVERNTEGSKDDPCDTQNLERVTQVHLECHQFLLVS